MNKKIVVNSLKGIVFAGAMAIGFSFFGGQAKAAELTATEINTVVQQDNPGTLLSPVMDNALSTADKVAAPVDNIAAEKADKVASSLENIPTQTVDMVVTNAVETAVPFAKAVTSTAVNTPTANTVENKESIIPETPPVQTGNPDQVGQNIKSETNSSLLNIGLSGSLLQPVLGDVNISVLGNKKVQTEDGTYTTGGVLQADITGSSLLGDNHAGVIEATNINTDDYSYTHSALADVNVEGSIINDAHVGVVEKETVQTDDYSWEHSGLVIVDTKDTPLLGDLHTGVLEEEKYDSKKDDSTQSGGDSTQPGGDNTQPGGETTEPGGDNTQPGGETTEPGGDTTQPNSESHVPVVNTANSGSNNLNVKQISSDGSNAQLKTSASGNLLPVTGSPVDSLTLMIFGALIIALGFVIKVLRLYRGL